MKIFPVSSGKGGVGKTTFALNFALALAKHKKTVLIDMDSGTSSVRNCLAVNISRDLYHFLKKNQPLNECLTQLDSKIDPDGVFRNFTFLASPKNFVHDIVNLNEEAKKRLSDGINSLSADFIVIDMKAGLDTNVLDFLPYSNTGIILFTPKVKAAIATATEITRANLLRSLRLLFFAPRAIEQFKAKFAHDADYPAPTARRIFDRLDEQQILNFDQFLLELDQELPQKQFIELIAQHIAGYKVYFILNQFNSVEESIRHVIQPFFQAVARSISPKIAIHNLGWLVASEEIKNSSESGIPFLIQQYYQKKKLREKPEQSFDALLRERLGVVKKIKVESSAQKMYSNIGQQLELLRKIYVHSTAMDPETNIEFIVESTQSILSSSVHDLGMKRVMSGQEFISAFYSKAAS